MFQHLKSKKTIKPSPSSVRAPRLLALQDWPLFRQMTSSTGPSGPQREVSPHAASMGHKANQAPSMGTPQQATHRRAGEWTLTGDPAQCAGGQGSTLSDPPRPEGVHPLLTSSSPRLLPGVAPHQHTVNPERALGHSCQLTELAHKVAQNLRKGKKWQRSGSNLKVEFRSSRPGAAERNPTRNHEVAGSIPGLAPWVKDSGLLWLWCRPAAAGLIQPLAWEPPYVARAAPKKQQQQTRNMESCTRKLVTSPKRELMDTDYLWKTCFVLFFFFGCPMPCGVPGPGIRSELQLHPCQILNPLCWAGYLNPCSRDTADPTVPQWELLENV